MSRVLLTMFCLGLVTASAPTGAASTAPGAAPSDVLRRKSVGLDIRVGMPSLSLASSMRHRSCVDFESRQKIRGRIDRDVITKARRYLDLPLGTGHSLDVKGQRYLFCLERHYREPGAGRGPTGWHKGVTVYELPSRRAETS